MASDGRDLFRQLLRLYPGALLEDYCRNNLFDTETIAIDIELLERHREESGAPEPPPLEEIPEVKPPEPVAPPWASLSRSKSSPPRSSTAIGSGVRTSRVRSPQRSLPSSSASRTVLRSSLTRSAVPTTAANYASKRRIDEVESVSNRPRPSSYYERPGPPIGGSMGGSRGPPPAKRSHTGAKVSEQSNRKTTKEDDFAAGDLIKLLLE